MRRGEVRTCGSSSRSKCTDSPVQPSAGGDVWKAMVCPVCSVKYMGLNDVSRSLHRDSRGHDSNIPGYK